MARKALIVVDVQNDFLPEGALAIQGGDQIIPIINQLVKAPFDAVVATKDWHPINHGSFAFNQGKLVGEVILLNGINQILWPVHCVQGTQGSDFPPSLETEYFEKIFYKGMDPGVDSYSCFFDNGHQHSTGMETYLRFKEIEEVYFAGLATDYCVKYSVFDACQLGFRSYIIVDACQGVDIEADDCRHALEQMQGIGAQLITSNQILHSKQLS